MLLLAALPHKAAEGIVQRVQLSPHRNTACRGLSPPLQAQPAPSSCSKAACRNMGFTPHTSPPWAISLMLLVLSAQLSHQGHGRPEVTFRPCQAPPRPRHALPASHREPHHAHPAPAQAGRRTQQPQPTLKTHKKLKRHHPLHTGEHPPCLTSPLTTSVPLNVRAFYTALLRMRTPARSPRALYKYPRGGPAPRRRVPHSARGAGGAGGTLARPGSL